MNDRPRCLARALATCAITLVAALLPAAAALARERMQTPANDPWKAECGSCHVAYPPRLLTAHSWFAVMDGLDHHFGVDASMDSATAASIRTFLGRNAVGDRTITPGKPVLRITETRRFLHEHDEVRAATWRDPRVGSAANCAACHPNAENGRFSEHDVRIPR